MSEFIPGSPGNVYKDIDGNDCSLFHLVNNSPEWACSRISEGEKAAAELEKYSEYTICDCCQSLTLEPVDAGGHMQCVSCTKLAELEQRIHDASEVYAEVEGFFPRNAEVAYTLRVIKRMYEELQEKGE